MRATIKLNNSTNKNIIAVKSIIRNISYSVALAVHNASFTQSDEVIVYTLITEKNEKLTIIYKNGKLEIKGTPTAVFVTLALAQEKLNNFSVTFKPTINKIRFHANYSMELAFEYLKNVDHMYGDNEIVFTKMNELHKILRFISYFQSALLEGNSIITVE